MAGRICRVKLGAAEGFLEKDRVYLLNVATIYVDYFFMLNDKMHALVVFSTFETCTPLVTKLEAALRNDEEASYFVQKE